MNRRMERAFERALGWGWRPRRRPNPLVWSYRWRYELGLLLALVGLVVLGAVVHWSVPVLLVALAIVLAVVLPDLRAAVRMRVHAVVIQHRLRTAFRESGLYTWRGRLPAILWTAPQPTGVLVHVSLPAGIEVNDLEELAPVLAAACFAVEVTVRPNPRFSNVVELFVVTEPAADDGPDSGGPITRAGEP